MLVLEGCIGVRPALQREAIDAIANDLIVSILAREAKFKICEIKIEKQPRSQTLNEESKFILL